MLWNLPVPITNFYLANGAKLSEVLILLHKMETRIWNKTRIWNTFSDDQEVFHIRVYTVPYIFSKTTSKKKYGRERPFHKFWISELSQGQNKKNEPILQEGGSTLAPPTSLEIRVVLLHTERLVKSFCPQLYYVFFVQMKISSIPTFCKQKHLVTNVNCLKLLGHHVNYVNYYIINFFQHWLCFLRPCMSLTRAGPICSLVFLYAFSLKGFIKIYQKLIKNLF